jgi:allantoicase
MDAPTMDATHRADAAPLPAWASTSTNLADARLGATALSCSDDFFAPMARMLQAGPAVFVPGKYDEHGKWMDGWESRRRRGAGHDWCVVRLGVPGQLLGVDIDTSFFTGNYPPSASIDACALGADPAQPASWRPWLSMVPLQGNRHHWVEGPPLGSAVSHVRLNIFPDGGVARLRVYGRPDRSAVQPGPDGLVDLLALAHGGRAIDWNDAHFGACSNLLLPGRGADMGDGWETRRRREPGHDWCILALGVPGRIHRIEVDTAHFKGNYPDRCSLQAVHASDVPDSALRAAAQFWPTLLPESGLRADAVHTFAESAFTASSGPVSHVRFNLFPDGGVSRLRLWGTPT